MTQKSATPVETAPLNLPPEELHDMALRLRGFVEAMDVLTNEVANNGSTHALWAVLNAAVPLARELSLALEP